MSGMPAKLGAYLVEAELGRGGMGVVYLARDPSLDRKVAIKVLPQELSGSADRMGRFMREARTLASLNHPNVAAVHGLHADGGHQMLVLEYVPGQHLGERLRDGPALSVNDALTLAVQIAAGLEAAHDSGIIHRDVKPANIRVRPDGVIKVLDFGLAKSDAPVGALTDDDDTLSFAQTEAGRVLGTAGYMSPEQARGKPVDKRADIWGFGAVLFECLAGARAFPGETPMDAIVAILEREPPWGRLPAHTPPRIVDLLRRCLEKEAARRLRDIGDARIELEDALVHAGVAPRSSAGWGSTVSSLRALAAAATAAGAQAPGSSASSGSGLRAGPRGYGMAGGVSVLQAATNLPSTSTRFVGRVDILRDATQTLASTRLLTLASAGGCGKSRIAVELAMRTRDQYEAGSWWLDVATIKDPGMLIAQVAGALGAASTDLHDPADTLAEALNHRSILLVLDNCEGLLRPAAAAAATLLNVCPGMRILATSREPLGAEGERVLRVPVMAVPPEDALHPTEVAAYEAVELFTDRARAVRPGFELDHANAHHVAELCRRLDGMPLAIELAASRVKVLSPEQICQRLEDRFRLLGGSKRTASGRNRALEAAIAWSFEQLDDDERAAFRRLCVFCGGLTMSGAEAVCAGSASPDSPGLEPWDVIDIVAQLIDKSMLVVDEHAEPTHAPAGEPRYTLLETVRQFGLQRLAETGETDTMRHRHLAWTADLAASAEAGLIGRHECDWFKRLALDHPNIRAALHWALHGQGDLELARRIGAGVWRFWICAGHVPEGRRHLVELERRSAGAPPSAAWARVREGISWAAQTVGDLPAAIMFARAGLDMARAINDRPTIGGLLNCLGAACRGDGLSDRAVDYFQEAIAFLRDLGRPLQLADCHARLAECLRSLGDRDAAADHLARARELALPEGDTLVLAQIIARGAWLALHAGRADEAALQAGDALARFAALGAHGELPEVLELIACIAVARGQPADAARHLGAAHAARKRFAMPARPAVIADSMTYLDQLRAALPPAEAEALRREGAAVSLSRAVRALLRDAGAPIIAGPE